MDEDVIHEFEVAQLDALQDKIGADVAQVSHILLYDTTQRAYKAKLGRFNMDSASLLATGTITQEEIDTFGGDLSSVLPAAVITWCQSKAAARTMRGETRTFLARVVSSAPRAPFLFSSSFTCSAEVTAAEPEEPLTAHGAREGAEVAAYTGVRDLVGAMADHVRVMRDSDHYLDTKLRRVLDTTDRVETIHREHLTRLSDENKELRGQLERTLDKLLSHRLDVVEAKEKEAQAKIAAAEVENKGEATGVIGKLGERGLDMVEKAIMVGGGVPPQLADLMGRLMGNERSRKLLEHPKLGDMLTNPEMLDALDKFLED